MRVLLDECVPVRLRSHVPDHDVRTVQFMRWNGIKNGELLRLMSEAGMEVFVTVDSNLKFQQDVRGSGIAVVQLSAETNRIQDLVPPVHNFAQRLAGSSPANSFRLDPERVFSRQVFKCGHERYALPLQPRIHPMPIHKGDRAPVFKLPAKPKEETDVGALIGKEKIVLLFFPLAFSSVCTAEMCAMRDEWKQYESLNAKVFGISVDSPFVTDKFRQSENIPFPILSDFNKEVIKKYGVVMDDLIGLKGVAKRSAFVIGRDGTIKYAWVSDNPGVQPNYAEIKAALREA